MVARRRARYGPRVLLSGLLLAGAGLYAYLQRDALPRPTAAVATVAVLTAAHDVGVAQQLGPADLATAVVPADTALGHAVPAAQVAGVLGARARVPLYTGQVLQAETLYGTALAATRPVDLLRPGERLYTLRALPAALPLTGLAGGDRVDIYATVQRAPAPEGPSTLLTGQTVVTGPLVHAATVVAVSPTVGLMTLAVPAAAVPLLIYADGTALLSFAQLRPDDRTPAPLGSLDTRGFTETVHAAP